MATQQRTVDFLVEQVARAGAVTQRKMFGEYALYLGSKVVALVCNDLLYIKATAGALALVPDPVMAPPYPGAKPHICLEGALDDPDLVIATLRAVAADLPDPKPKPKKAKL